MLVIGLTGNLASGKTTVLKLLRAKGARTFDADKCVHQHYQNRSSAVFKKVAATFPEALSRGRICRRLLSEMVFSDSKSLSKLERIIHPVVIKELLTWIKECRKQTRAKVCVAEVPLLFEKRLARHFDLVILVKLNRAIQIKRLNKLHGFSKRVTLKRLSLYLPLKEKIKGADYIIDNSKNIKSLDKEVDLLWKSLKQK